MDTYTIFRNDEPITLPFYNSDLITTERSYALTAAAALSAANPEAMFEVRNQDADTIGRFRDGFNYDY